MQLQTLRYFLDIAQTHSINQSAKKFFVSQQVMSKSIKNLEIELAVKLLNRTKTGVTLTLAGEVLLNRAQEIIAAYDELCDELLPFQQPTTDCRGNITVYITPKLSELFYELLLVKLPQELPRCSISLHTMESEKIVQKQYFNKTEIGLITVGLENLQSDAFQILLQKRHLKAVSLAQYPLFVCMHTHAPWINKDTFTLEELKDIPVAFFEPNSFLLPSSQFSLTAQYAVQSVELQKKIVQQKLGAVLLPKLEYDLLFGQSDKYLLRPLEGAPDIAYVYITAAECELSLALKQFIIQLEKVIF